ncbi:TolB family protein [Streptomyces filamentosus]
MTPTTPAVSRRRLLVLSAVAAGLSAVAGVSVLRGGRAGAGAAAGGPPVAAGPVALAGPGGHRMVARNLVWGPYRDALSVVPADGRDGPRTASEVRCLRFHAAAGTGVCLQAVPGATGVGYRAVVLDAELREVARHALPGVPSRARVAPDGRRVAWTVFVGGDTYADSSFSTRTAVLDLGRGRLEANLEEFAVVLEGRPYRAPDVNVWGVTFGTDPDVFHATLATRGTAYLVRGDLRARTLTTLARNVECPSLAPGGDRIVHKKRVPGLPPEAPWRLYARDLATGAERPLAETRSVDDQVVWADARTVVYALPGDFGADLYAVPADGSGSPRLVARSAVSPAFLD